MWAKYKLVVLWDQSMQVFKVATLTAPPIPSCLEHLHIPFTFYSQVRSIKALAKRESKP